MKGIRMQVNSVKVYKNNSVSFNANLKLRHILNVKNEPILTKDFVKYYTNKVNQLGKQTDSVEINVIPHPRNSGDYLMDVEVIRNNENYKQAQSLLLCQNIEKALPEFLEGEYKWLDCWFKDKNGTEILKQ